MSTFESYGNQVVRNERVYDSGGHGIRTHNPFRGT
jgi:hypothetical protein